MRSAVAVKAAGRPLLMALLVATAGCMAPRPEIGKAARAAIAVCGGGLVERRSIRLRAAGGRAGEASVAAEAIGRLEAAFVARLRQRGGDAARLYADYVSCISARRPEPVSAEPRIRN